MKFDTKSAEEQLQEQLDAFREKALKMAADCLRETESAVQELLGTTLSIPAPAPTVKKTKGWSEALNDLFDSTGAKGVRLGKAAEAVGVSSDELANNLPAGFARNRSWISRS